MTRWQRHLHRAHVLYVRPREVASLFSALVVPKQPAEELGLLLAALLVVLHGQQRGLADRQKVPGLQIQVLLLVLSERVEGNVLKTFRRHFVWEDKSKWLPDRGFDGTVRVALRRLKKSSSETEKAVESLKRCRYGAEGNGASVSRRSEALLKVDAVAFGCCSVRVEGVGGAAASDLTGVGGLVHFPQLETPVEPDDGAEGEHWQHALISSENPAGRALLERPTSKGESRARRRWLAAVKCSRLIGGRVARWEGLRASSSARSGSPACAGRGSQKPTCRR